MSSKLFDKFLRWTLPEKPKPTPVPIAALNVICPRMLGIICTAELRSKRPYHFVTSVTVEVVTTCPGEVLFEIDIKCGIDVSFEVKSGMRMILLDLIADKYGMYRIVSDEQYDEMRGRHAG